MQLRSSIVQLVSGASLVLAPFLAFTQQAKQDSLRQKNLDLDECIITGQYQETSMRKSVYRIKTIDSQRIQAQGAFNIQQVLSNELNVRILQDPILGSAVKLQGVGGNNVKVLIDGVPVLGREGGNIDLTQINLNQVDRIELVEGPMSVNFGTDALGGVINIITKRPKRERTQGNLRAHAESVYQVNFDGSVQVQKGKNGFSAGLGRNFFGGYSENPTSRTKLWKPRTQYNANLDFSRYINKGMIRWSNQLFREKLSNRGEPEVDWTKATAIDQYFFTNRFGSSLFFDFKPEKKRNLNLVIAYNFYQRSLETTLKNLVTLSETPVPSSTARDTTRFHQWMSRGTYSNVALNKSIAYQLGYEVNTETASGSRIVDQQTISDFSCFGSMEIKAGNRLLMRPAMRISKHSLFSVPLMPSFNIKFDFNEFVQLRGSYGKGFRAPGMKELFLQFADVNHNIEGNPNLKPEHSDNMQVSIAFDHKEENRVFRLEPSLFYNRISDMIGLARTGIGNNAGFRYFNLNSFESHGLNINTEYRRPVYSVSIGYALTGNKNSFGNQASIDQFFYSQEFRLNCSYHIEKVGLGINFFSKYNGRYQSFQYLAETNTTAITSMDGFFLADLSMNKSLFKKKLDIHVGVKNLNNLTNINGNFSTGPHGGLTNSAMLGMGRIFFTSLNYKLN